MYYVTDLFFNGITGCRFLVVDYNHNEYGCRFLGCRFRIYNPPSTTKSATGLPIQLSLLVIYGWFSVLLNLTIALMLVQDFDGCLSVQ